MTDAVIVLNAGSTSLKFGAYGVDGAKTLPLLCQRTARLPRRQITCAT